MSRGVTVAVVGGGIAGLSAAYELLQRSGAPEVLLFEASDRLGGKLHTEQRAGYTLELGPDSFLASKPAARELAQDLGLTERLIGTNPEQRAVYVRHGGRLEPLPDGLTMMTPTSLRELLGTRLVSWRGKLRAALEPLLPPRLDEADESIRAFISRRFGGELYEGLLEPLMTGIYAGNGDRLSVLATFPRLRQWEREHGSATAGARRLRQRRRSQAQQGEGRAPNSLFLSLENGLGELVEALAQQLAQAHIHLNSAIASVRAEGDRLELRTQDGRSYRADALVLAVPSFAAAACLRHFDRELAGALDQIEYASTVTVNLGYEAARPSRPLDGYGYLVPRAEGRPALACSWSSTKYPVRAPDGALLLRVFFGRAGAEGWVERTENELIAAARAEVESGLGLHQAPALTRVQRWPRALPQYNLGHLERVARIEQLSARHPGLQLAGAAYRGLGIPDCIDSGRAAARALLDPASPRGQPA